MSDKLNLKQPNQYLPEIRESRVLLQSGSDVFRASIADVIAPQANIYIKRAIKEVSDWQSKTTLSDHFQSSNLPATTTL